MVGTELLFVLILFVVRATPVCRPSEDDPGIASCTGHSFNSFTDIGEDFRRIIVENPPNAAFVVDKSKNQYLHLINSLDLRLTKALVISEYGFKDFVSLSSLILEGCFMAALKGTWFLANNNITYFACSQNKLRTLSKANLENLKKVLVADFSHNLLESIEPNAFFEMKDLRELRLEGNKLKSIPTGSLTMLKLIRMNHNLIEIVPEKLSTEMPKLRAIYFQHNALRKIEDGAFKDLYYLSDLDLSNNFIEEITEFTFAGFSKTILYGLDLSSNKIRRIAPGAFKEMHFIKFLKISWNSITELNENTFEGLDAEHLLLDHNIIELIGNNTFRGLTRLTELSINNNTLHSLTTGIFGTNLRYLKLFFVRGNSISTLDSEVFKFTPNIIHLAISFNKLQILPEEIFVPLTKLETLQMQGNFLEELTEVHIASLKSVKFLYINHNKLTFIPLNRDFFPNLRIMNIGGNPWQCACLDEVQKFLNEKKIKFFKEYYFDGQCPVCVPTYFEHCEQDTAFARYERISENYTDDTEQCRIKYLKEQQRYE